MFGILHHCYHSTTTTTNALRIAVIGGGASGIFSSIHAASSKSNEVVVFESSPKTLGKVKISGGGRCNVLHDTTSFNGNSKQLLEESYPRGTKELRGLYSKYWTPINSRNWFEERIPLKTEADGRMFPVTDTSQSIITALLDAADEAGVQIRTKSKVRSIEKDADLFRIHLSEDKIETFDSIILATGSSRVGYDLARELGHTIIDPVPSLFTFNVAKTQIKDHDGLFYNLAGVSVPNVQLSLTIPSEKKKKKVLKQEGPLLITHHGISGPATLRLSAFGARELHNMKYKGDMYINWIPNFGNEEDVVNQLWKYTTLIPKRAISTSCPIVLAGGNSSIPKRLWSSLILNQCRISKELKWCEASKKQIRLIAQSLIKNKIEIIGKSTNKEEFVTAGGIDLKEVNMKTMESKICSNLFLCGEILNVDAITGGFNFMGCWSTGYTAGTHAKQGQLAIQEK